MKARDVYLGSDGDVTKAYYAELSKRGLMGQIAVNLFRASKCSARAKVYRGGVRGRGSYKSMAYDRKNWSIEQLSTILSEHAATVGITWGWKQDPRQEYHQWVMYVDLPQGQVSFHSASKRQGPIYAGQWDGSHQSAERIIEFCDQVFKTVLSSAPEATRMPETTETVTL